MYMYIYIYIYIYIDIYMYIFIYIYIPFTHRLLQKGPSVAENVPNNIS